MIEEIIAVPMSGVNCYLLKTERGFALIDTGLSFSRRTLLKTLDREGCRPGDLNIVIITHADFDHIGNCRYLKKKYGVKIAMHPAEFPSAEHSDMTANRATELRGFPRAMMVLFKWTGCRSRFAPDISLDEGDSLTDYGLDARVLHLPGHSRGSLGVLTASGELFCGDLLTGGLNPKKNSLIDVAADMDDSIGRIRDLPVTTVYPGHGRPFLKERFFELLS